MIPYPEPVTGALGEQAMLLCEAALKFMEENKVRKVAEAEARKREQYPQPPTDTRRKRGVPKRHFRFA